MSKDSANTAASSVSSNTLFWSGRIGPVFYFGLITGFVLILIGGAALKFALTFTLLEMLIVCSGLGIILGAFGSVASVNIPVQGIALTGVAAISVALFYILLGNMSDKYMRVNIDGDIGTVEAIEFIGDERYLGAFQASQERYSFIVFGNKIEKPLLTLRIKIAGKDEPVPFTCIHRELLTPHLASGKTVYWRYDKKKSRLVDAASDNDVSTFGPCRQTRDDMVASHINHERKRSWYPSFSLISLAYAGTEQGTSIDDLIVQLKSDIWNVRSSARDQLAERGFGAVKPLLEAFSSENDIYRIKLGVLVSLIEMIRIDDKYGVYIRDNIDEQNIQHLVHAVNDKDKTVRVYATQLLSLVKHPQTIGLALKSYPDAILNGKYNYALLIKNTINTISATERQNVVVELGKLVSDKTPKTNVIINEIVAGNKT